MDFALPADHRVKLKESEKRDKYPDPAILVPAFHQIGLESRSNDPKIKF